MRASDREPTATAHPGDEVTLGFSLTEPGTDRRLQGDGADLVGPDGARYPCTDGIWDFIGPSRRDAVEAFAADYAAIRHREHRTPLSAEAVAALPYRDLSGHLPELWAQRAAAFDRFRTLMADRRPQSWPGLMVDVGAGCGWLAARMAADGWRAAAVDITIEGDGLHAARLTTEDLLLARAEMDVLPFATASVDLVVCNASLHYAPDVGRTLDEAVRVTRPGGVIAVLDSPVFTDPAAGRRMVEEFAIAARANHGVEAAAHFGPGFVTEKDLTEFRDRHRPSDWVRRGARPGIFGALRSMVGARRAGREIADRPLIVAEMPAEVRR